MTWSHCCVEWTRTRGSITVATKFRYWVVARIPSPPLEERVRERRPFVSKLICHNTSRIGLGTLRSGPPLNTTSSSRPNAPGARANPTDD